MRRIALINQKGGVGKTTTAVNLAAALTRLGQRVVVVDLDPQANLTLHLGLGHEPEVSSYHVLVDRKPFRDALLETGTEGLQAVASDLDLSGAELELANAFGRETLLRDALGTWCQEHEKEHGGEPADFVLFDCPPSLGLLSINGLAAADEVFVPVQTHFFALQGMSKLVEIVDLIRQRLHPGLRLAGIVPCLYDSRLRLAREVLAEIREFFPDQAFRQAIGSNVKLAEAPSFGQTIFQYAPESPGARDYLNLAREVLERADVGEDEKEEGSGDAVEASTPEEPARETPPAPEPTVEVTPTAPPEKRGVEAAPAPAEEAVEKAPVGERRSDEPSGAGAETT